MLRFVTSLRTLVLPAVILFAAAPLFADEAPARLNGAFVVDASKAQTLVGTGAIVIDTRVGTDFDGGHIKGAKNIPYKELSAHALNYDNSADSFNIALLPKKKDMALIFYSNGASCWKSYKAAMLAVRAGYSNVYWLREGMPGWKSQGLPVD